MAKNNKQYGIEDVKASNKRFYEKFPSAKEDAAMLKRAMQDNANDIVKQVDQEKVDRENFMQGLIGIKPQGIIIKEADDD
jgi:DeoR/GlpR family transcriptional regulator of sugar metabolism